MAEGETDAAEVVGTGSSGPRRRARSGRRGRGAEPAPAYIRRQIPFYEFLGEEQLERIEGQAERLLAEIGIEFRQDPEALQIWRRAGADVCETRVRLPRGMARELLATAPSEFTQHARNPARSVRLGGSNQVFAPIYGAPFVRDLKGGRRYGSIGDFEKLVKLTWMLPSLHHSGFVTCEPCDVPVNKRHLDMLYAHMRWSDKPHLGAIVEKDRAEDSVAMARILHTGREDGDLGGRCVIMGNVNSNSPLMVYRVVTEAIRVYCGAGQGIIVAPFIISGAMGPVSTAASVAQALAEGMACGAFSQLIRPGAPFVLGPFLSSMSLKSGAPTFGMPEPVMAHLVIGQLARRLGVPLRCGGALTASKIPDAQAAAESADSMFSSALGGANFILHSAGWLEGALCTGYEKLIIDADRLGVYQAMLQGMATDDNALGVHAYDDVEPAGHFLGSAHTMANYRTAFFESAISDSESCEQWEDHGAKDAARCAYERWNQLLADYEAPEIDPGLGEALKDFIARRKAGMEDAWY